MPFWARMTLTLRVNVWKYLNNSCDWSKPDHVTLGAGKIRHLLTVCLTKVHMIGWNPNGIPTRSMENIRWHSGTGTDHHKSWPQNMCYTHSWRQHEVWFCLIRCQYQAGTYLLKMYSMQKVILTQLTSNPALKPFQLIVLWQNLNLVSVRYVIVFRSPPL